MGKNNKTKNRNNQNYHNQNNCQNRNQNTHDINESQNNHPQQNFPTINNSLNVEQNTVRVNVPTNYLLVDQKEYMLLCNENREMKEKISLFYANERILQQTIENGKATIEELRKENMELKEKLLKVERELSDANEKIESLGSKIDNICLKNAFKKYMIAIQDINSQYQLELCSDKKCAGMLKRLRRNRVNDCHYINNDFDDSEIELRVNLLCNRLKNMDHNIKAKFDKLYPGLIEKLPHIIPISKDIDNSNFDDDVLNDAEIWWEFLE